MTFEEFFRKKRIDLVALEKAEPALLSEFKTHFEQMGEKSFDHTKKYWFNKLRLTYHLAPEPKVEKVIIENTLAEQTITESLLESSAPPAIVGFKPRFKPGMGKPAETPAPEAKKSEEATEPTVPPPANAGFKPRFKAGATKPVEPIAEQKEEPKAERPIEDKPAEATEPKPAVGFKPRFKMKPKDEE